MELNGKVAVITGGASGLGQATVEMLVEKGAKVVIFDLDEAKGNALVGKLGDSVRFQKVDITEEGSVKAAVEYAVETFGTVHICVNCAGVGTPGKTIGKKGILPLDKYKQVIEINLIGTFNVLSQAANVMKDNEPVTDSGKRGVIINTASVAAFDGQMGQAAYGASKAGVAGMTLPVARDLSQYGIRVNTIAPGLFMTPMAASLPENVVEKLGASVEFPKRLGHPREFAQMASYLMEHEYMNGEVIRLDGGIRMSPR